MTVGELEKYYLLVQALHPGSRLLRTGQLKGGISSQMTALEIEQADGKIRRLIVRQLGQYALRLNASAVADEFRLLQTLTTAGLPVPVPLHLDARAELLSTPSLIIEYVEGEPMIAPYDAGDVVSQMAGRLAQIHALPASRPDLAFLPRQTDELERAFDPESPDLTASLGEQRIIETLQSVWPLPPSSAHVLLHGDFWPGNIIWREKQIVAVIDWTEALLGDRLRDVSFARLDILLAYGYHAMCDFTACYRSTAAGSEADWANLPHWDLFAALRPIGHIAAWAGGWTELGRTDITEATIHDGHRQFTAHAFRALGLAGTAE